MVMRNESLGFDSIVDDVLDPGNKPKRAHNALGIDQSVDKL